MFVDPTMCTITDHVVPAKVIASGYRRGKPGKFPEDRSLRERISHLGNYYVHRHGLGRIASAVIEDCFLAEVDKHDFFTVHGTNIQKWGGCCQVVMDERDGDGSIDLDDETLTFFSNNVQWHGNGARDLGLTNADLGHPHPHQ